MDDTILSMGFHNMLPRDCFGCKTARYNMSLRCYWMQVTFTQGTQILGIDLALVYVICPVALFLALNLDSVIMTHSFVYVTHVLVTKVVLRMRHYWRSMPKWVVIVADRFIFWSLVFISTSFHLKYSLMSPEFTKQVQFKS